MMVAVARNPVVEQEVQTADPMLVEVVEVSVAETAMGALVLGAEVVAVADIMEAEPVHLVMEAVVVRHYCRQVVALLRESGLVTDR
jgi:hypothetical protein